MYWYLAKLNHTFFPYTKSSWSTDHLANETCHFQHLPVFLIFVPTASFVSEVFKFPSKSHRTPPRSLMVPYLQLWLQKPAVSFTKCLTFSICFSNSNMWNFSLISKHFIKKSRPAFILFLYRHLPKVTQKDSCRTGKKCRAPELSIF